MAATHAEEGAHKGGSRRRLTVALLVAVAGVAGVVLFVAREIRKDAALRVAASSAINPANQGTLDAFGYEAIHSTTGQADRVTLRLHIDHKRSQRISSIRIDPESITVLYDDTAPEQVVPIGGSAGKALVDLKLVSRDKDPFFWAIVDVVNAKQHARDLEVMVTEGPKTEISAKAKNAHLDRGVYLFFNTQDVEANHTQISQMSHVNLHVGLTKERWAPLEEVANKTRLVPLQGKYHLAPDGLTSIPDPFPLDQHLSLYSAGAYNANIAGSVTHDARDRTTMESIIDSVKRNHGSRGR